jgi:RimJ/RimL family protein N-acetyltransferase
MIELGPVGGITLRELRPSDLPSLFSITPPETFRYFLAEPDAWTLEAFTRFAQSHLFRADQRPLAVIDHALGTILGSSSLMDLQPAHRHVEIGCTWYAPQARGSRVNPACKLMMLEHAFTRLFEGQGAVRVTLKCDARNLHSQNAIAKLGATREGTLRRHRIRPDGFVRDTVYFSILPDEWPRVREGLLARLAATPEP